MMKHQVQAGLNLITEAFQDKGGVTPAIHIFVHKGTSKKMADFIAREMEAKPDHRVMKDGRGLATFGPHIYVTYPVEEVYDEEPESLPVL